MANRYFLVAIGYFLEEAHVSLIKTINYENTTKRSQG